MLTNRKGELALGLADDCGHHAAAEALVKAINEQNIQGRPKDCFWTKHSNTGASLLHYFAAYSTEKGGMNLESDKMQGVDIQSHA